MIAKLGINFQNPPIEVSHFTLDGAGRPNQWKSECTTEFNDLLTFKNCPIFYLTPS